MLRAYIISLLLLSLLIIYCIIKTVKIDSPLSSPIRKLMISGLLALISNTVLISVQSVLIGTIAYSCFIAIIDWVIYYLCQYIIVFSEHKRYSKAFKTTVAFVLIIDNISIMLNVFFNHVFEIKPVLFLNKYSVLSPVKFSIYYDIHLLLSYIMVAFGTIVLVSKIFKSSSFYRKKYVVVFLQLAVILILDGISVMFKLPINVSIIYYVAIALVVFYYSLLYMPNKLLNNLIQLAVSNISRGFFCFDNSGRCIYANNRAWEVFGIEPDFSLAEKEYLEHLKNSEFIKSDHSTIEKIYKIKGEERHIEIENVNMRDDNNIFVGAYFSVSDITEQVLKHEQEMEEERKASKARIDFLSKISHEIRTPVNSIMGMNEMILRESNQDEIKNYAEDIKNSAEVLISIINDILDLNKIESAKMTLVDRSYSVKTLINNIINMISMREETKKLEFITEISPDIPSVLFGDDIRVQQIIMNLLTNAVKYTPKGKVIFTITCQTFGNSVILDVKVSDTGIGIKKEDIPRLFSAFERMDEVKNHSIQGTGLGLNITNMLLKMMKSELIVESEYGVGSTFYFSLMQKIIDNTPIGDLNKEQITPQKEYSALFTSPDSHILLVDDNTINRKVFKNLLKQTLIQITDVASGQECLDLVKENHYDLIFLDHMMPEMDGIETFEAMKKLEGNKCAHTPVIMLTANAISGAKEEYINLGFNDFLSKPIIPESLESIVKKYLQ